MKVLPEIRGNPSSPELVHGAPMMKFSPSSAQGIRGNTGKVVTMDLVPVVI